MCAHVDSQASTAPVRLAQVIHVNDAYANGYLSVMQEWDAENEGASVRAVASFDYGDSMGAREAVATIAASQLNVIVVICFDADLEARIVPSPDCHSFAAAHPSKES